MRFSIEEMEAAFTEINEHANPKLALLGALSGSLPAIAVYFLFMEMGGLLLIMLFLSPLIIGYFARFVGRTYKVKHRISVGVIGALVYIIGCILLGLGPLYYLLVPVAFGVAMTTAKIKLYRVHEWAIEWEENGKLFKNKSAE
ncbi:hypothetical protein WNY63_04905 [Pseudoalteromonas neustonica]|uniref:Uncharacterized protein n=1 Tax=Pseudoalteromonas neustonica TaxID=1840331 RepID=A0ABU9TZ47_9GAMM